MCAINSTLLNTPSSVVFHVNVGRVFQNTSRLGKPPRRGLQGLAGAYEDERSLRSHDLCLVFFTTPKTVSLLLLLGSTASFRSCTCILIIASIIRGTRSCYYHYHTGYDGQELIRLAIHYSYRESLPASSSVWNRTSIHVDCSLLFSWFLKNVVSFFFYLLHLYLLQLFPGMSAEQGYVMTHFIKRNKGPVWSVFHNSWK